MRNPCGSRFHFWSCLSATAYVALVPRRTTTFSRHCAQLFAASIHPQARDLFPFRVHSEQVTKVSPPGQKSLVLVRELPVFLSLLSEKNQEIWVLKEIKTDVECRWLKVISHFLMSMFVSKEIKVSWTYKLLYSIGRHLNFPIIAVC